MQASDFKKLIDQLQYNEDSKNLKNNTKSINKILKKNNRTKRTKLK